MKNKYRKNCLIIALLLVFSISGMAYAATYEWPVSASIIYEENCQISASLGETIKFSCSDIETRLGLKSNSLDGITITVLPHTEVGTLMLNGKPVDAYRKLTRSDIERLEFVPVTSEIASTSFSFLPMCQSGVLTTMSVNLIEAPNASPVAKTADYSTRQNIDILGCLSIFEPDGDSYQIEITTKPEKGNLQIENNLFIYEPYLDKTGIDSFTYRAVDAFGNYSEETMVNLVIEKGENQTVYLDMQGNPAHYASIKLYENGILSGEQFGKSMMFYPDREITQCEFTMMICSALGLDQSADACVNTGLSNDTSLPLWLKPYIQALKEEDIFTESVFETEKVLTNAEAIRWINAAAKLPEAETTSLILKDTAQIPADYLQDYITFTAQPAFTCLTDYAQPASTLTRDTAAMLIWQLYKYANS